MFRLFNLRHIFFSHLTRDNVQDYFYKEIQFTDVIGNLYKQTFLSKSLSDPNQPGPILILEKTTSSISVEWGEAPLMANTTFSYLVKYLSTQRDSKTVTTTNTSQTLLSLSSGTPYNVSVVSVGVLGFHSEEVWSSSVTTSECQHARVHAHAQSFPNAYTQTQPPRDVCFLYS